MEQETTENETSRSLDILTQIEQNPDISQASLANELGVAVGTVNWYLKRLISKGYVKVKRAQRKKLRYIITPEGIALRTRLTVEYIQSSFELYRHTREKTTGFLQKVRQSGFTQVRIDGSGEIAEVCQLTCLEQNMTVTDQPTAPRIIIEGINLALELPREDTILVSSQPTNQRGDYG
ncbi:MAG: winged helix-turn-helix transcriptional regulator [Anaerolineaceae bacterium]|jgi:DNA-binding MarR family transcriptional regulator